MTDITATLWFLLLSALARADMFYLNKEMDGFFGQLREDIKLANNTKFPLSNVTVVYTKDILYFIKARGELNGTGGTIQDLSTIRRMNNVTLITAKNYFVLRLEFGFEDLKVGYDYKARLMGIPFSGEMEFNVKNNSIFLELLVNLTDDRCSGQVINVRNMRLTSLGNISVKVTGYSMFNRLANYLLTRAFSDLSTSITDPIQETLLAFFKANLRDFNFCQFGSVPDNTHFDDMDSSDDMAFNFVEGINATAQDIKAMLN